MTVYAAEHERRVAHGFQHDVINRFSVSKSSRPCNSSYNPVRNSRHLTTECSVLAYPELIRLLRTYWSNIMKLYMSFNLRQLVFIAALFAATSSIYGSESTNDVIESSALAAQIESGTAPLILDVRTPEEFAAGHIPDAINISHTELGERFFELEEFKNIEIVVYCRSGHRAGLAEAVLLDAGFTGVRDLEGHMLQWDENGYPIE